MTKKCPGCNRGQGRREYVPRSPGYRIGGPNPHNSTVFPCGSREVDNEEIYRSWECRANVAEAIVAKLSKCWRLKGKGDKRELVEDCPVAPGMRVYFWFGPSFRIELYGRTVASITADAWLTWVEKGPERSGKSAEDCYNSREAAIFAHAKPPAIPVRAGTSTGNKPLKGKITMPNPRSQSWECRAKAAEAIVAELHQTRDGVPVWRPRELFFIHEGRVTSRNFSPDVGVRVYFSDDEDDYAVYRVEDCFSTAEAAALADMEKMDKVVSEGMDEAIERAVEIITDAVFSRVGDRISVACVDREACEEAASVAAKLAPPEEPEEPEERDVPAEETELAPTEELDVPLPGKSELVLSGPRRGQDILLQLLKVDETIALSVETRGGTWVLLEFVMDKGIMQARSVGYVHNSQLETAEGRLIVQKGHDG